MNISRRKSNLFPEFSKSSRDWFFYYARVEILAQKSISRSLVSRVENAILVHSIFRRNGPKLQTRTIFKWAKIAIS